MTDRELLELAAKAAGYEIGWIGGIAWAQDGDKFVECWNPIADDGDALRLAVALGLQVTPEPAIGCVTAGIPDEGWQEERIDEGGDLCAATRRAIVRAAAAIAQEQEKS